MWDDQSLVGIPSGKDGSGLFFSSIVFPDSGDALGIPAKIQDPEKDLLDILVSGDCFIFHCLFYTVI